jgi:4-amino-4-deoxy-L-arabinose transferase-like glycosyltransferase
MGPTFDEPLYVKFGLERWRSGSTFELMRVGTMPLPVDVQSLPIHIWERWRGERFDPVSDLHRLLPIARGGNLVFWWILLYYGWRIARQIGGPWAGRLAVAVLACEPNLLAHASLATTDISIAACLLMFCWYYRNGRDGPWWKRVGLPTLCCAATLLAKASAIAFVPICMLVIEGERQWARLPELPLWPRIKTAARQLGSRQNRHDVLSLTAIAVLIVFVYCGCDWQPKPKFIAWAYTLPDGPRKTGVVWLAEHLRIFNNAGVGIWRQIKHNIDGHEGSFLLGNVAPRAFWYYFPVALSIKSPAPFLALLIGVAILRHRRLGNWAFLAALALLVFSLNCRVQIGVRLVLPVIVLGAIGVSAALTHALSQMCVQRKRLASGAVAILVSWMALVCVSAWPRALCYSNGLWDSRNRGYRLLSDSNYDWGQSLPDLAAWQRRANVPVIDVWYFGMDPDIDLPQFRYFPLHTLPITDEHSLCEHLHGRYFATSATQLFGSYCNDPKQTELLESLRRRRPAARAGTILIYDLERERAAVEAKRRVGGPAALK